MENALQNILGQLKERMPYIRTEYFVDTIEVFGSYAHGNQNSESDLDLLVTFIKTPGLISFLKLKHYLSDHLKLNIDLVMKDSLKPGLISEISKESIQIK